MTDGQTPEEARASGKLSIARPLGIARQFDTNEKCIALVAELQNAINRDPMCVILDGALARMGISRTRWANIVQSMQKNEEFNDALQIIDQSFCDRLSTMGMQKNSFSDRMALALLKNKHGFEGSEDNQERLPTVQIIFNGNGQDADTAKEFGKLRVVQSSGRSPVALPAPALPPEPDNGKEGKFMELVPVTEATRKTGQKIKGSEAKAIRATAKELMG